MSSHKMITTFWCTTTRWFRQTKKDKILVAPPGIKDIEWNSSGMKQSYLDVGYVEQKVGIAPEQTQLLSNNLQAQRKQYGLKHCIA